MREEVPRSEDDVTVNCPICDRPVYESELHHGHTWCAACRYARHTDRKLKALYAVQAAIPDEQRRLNAELQYMRDMLIELTQTSEAAYWEGFVTFLQLRSIAL
jgi:acetyl-CoA carboxylase beta subunit